MYDRPPKTPQTRSRLRYQQEGVEHRYRVEQWAAAERARDIGAKNWPEFRTLLICRFGNLMRAWREGSRRARWRLQILFL